MRYCPKRPENWNPIQAITDLQAFLERNTDMEVIYIIAKLETFKTYLIEMLGEM